VKRTSLITAFAAAILAAPAVAQGNLSTQGFGYPAGGMSSRALSMGGSVAELDPITTLNPAALTTWGRSGLYGQFGPELRVVKADGTQENSTIIRFPLFAGALTVTDQLIFGFSFSNLLDRTWGTQVNGYYHTSATDSVAYSQNFASAGAITNVRGAVGWRVSSTLRLGAAMHFYTGQQTVSINETFADTAGFASFFQGTFVNVSGIAGSVGLAYAPSPYFALGLSGQLGGAMRGRRNDSLVSNGRVPSRAGGSLLYAGITGVSLAVNAEWTQWSSMEGLAPGGPKPVDGWDYGVGTEIKLPGIAGAEIPLRAGVRWRTLPFQADSQTVRETVASFGFGIPVSGNRGRFDFGLLRAWRRADLPVQESAWTFSIGVLVRP
jgi:hypothetical protein